MNRIVAVVNDDIITQQDVRAFLDAAQDQEQPAAHSEPAGMQDAALQRLIEQRLLLQEAQRQNIAVEASEVLARFDQFREHLGSREAFLQSLQEMGLNEETLKDKLREQLMAQRLVDKHIRSTITISPQEVSAELGEHPNVAKAGDRVRASHILIRVSESRSEEQARQLAEQLHEQLGHGADFAELARRYSEDAQKDSGGRMDWVAPGDLLPELDQALFLMKIGELSAPIRSRLGFHLLKVDDRQDVSQLSLPEANRTVYQQIFQRKFRAAFTAWMNELKRKAYIQIPSAS